MVLLGHEKMICVNPRWMVRASVSSIIQSTVRKCHMRVWLIEKPTHMLGNRNPWVGDDTSQATPLGRTSGRTVRTHSAVAQCDALCARTVRILVRRISEYRFLSTVCPPSSRKTME